MDRRPVDTHTFCQIHFEIDIEMIGDLDAWSVSSLTIGAISDLIFNLGQQSILTQEVPTLLQKLNSQVLFDALYSWQWETGKWPYENEFSLSKFDVKLFNCLPLGTEIFDGEVAYLILNPNKSCRFIWRDYESRSIRERSVDFDYYLNQWDNVRATLISDTNEGA